MAQPHDETLSFSALMIFILSEKILFQFLLTSIITTHSNINSSDIFIIFLNITPLTYKNILLLKYFFIASVNNL